MMAHVILVSAEVPNTLAIGLGLGLGELGLGLGGLDNITLREHLYTQ